VSGVIVPMGQASPSLLERLFHVPETLFGLMRRKPKRSQTSKLYVLEVNFEVRPGSDAEMALNEQRQYLLNKYGIDLFVVEPGFKLKRFDDF
jgi:hypothetical protein